ncbi:MAG TPA: hypothetical protein VGE98_00580 [Thermoanaerobaculia bacterium]
MKKLSLKRETLHIEKGELPMAVGGSQINDTVYHPGPQRPPQPIQT